MSEGSLPNHVLKTLCIPPVDNNQQLLSCSQINCDYKMKPFGEVINAVYGKCIKALAQISIHYKVSGRTLALGLVCQLLCVLQRLD
jgi:hypothetical protein